MNKRFQLFLVGVTLFVFFVLFSYLVHKDFFTQFDFNTTVRLQDNISRRFDDLFSVFSDVGKIEVTGIVTFGVLMYFMIKKRLVAAVMGGLLFIGFHVIELYGKFFVYHPPPPEFLLRTKTMIDFPQFHVRSEFSYPSGHSGRTIFLSVLIIAALLSIKSRKFPKLLKLLMISGILVFDIIMLVSRVYLGEHWTTDVVGGAVLGGALGLVSIAFYIKNKSNNTKIPNPKQ